MPKDREAEEVDEQGSRRRAVAAMPVLTAKPPLALLDVSAQVSGVSWSKSAYEGRLLLICAGPLANAIAPWGFSRLAVSRERARRRENHGKKPIFVFAGFGQPRFPQWLGRRAGYE